jgi:hypothetical protein
LIKRSDVGKFIAENLHRDAKSKVFGASVLGLLAHDLGQFVASAGPDLLERLRRSNDKSFYRELDEKLTRLTGEDNLVGSSGEYGLLLLSSPTARGRKNWTASPHCPWKISNRCLCISASQKDGKVEKNASRLAKQQYGPDGKRWGGVSGPSEVRRQP